MKYLILIVLSLVVFSCKSVRIDESNETKAEINTASFKQILFLNLLFEYNSTDSTTKIGLINYQLVAGSVKTDFVSKTNPETGDISLEFLDIDKQTLNEIYFANPLFEHIEYVDENNNLKWQKLNHDSREFSIRTNLPMNSNFILIKELTDNNTYNIENELLIELTGN